MARHRSIAAFVRRRRAELGIPSAMALARKAGLSVNYVSIVERGERLPRWDTARKLADALELAGPQRDAFMRTIDAAAKPPSAQRATTGPTLLRHLPAALLRVEHPTLAIYDPTAEELVVDLVRGVASLLGCLILRLRPPGRAERVQLGAAARRVFESVLALHREIPNLGSPSPQSAACQVASFLPVAWRQHLFADPRRTAGAMRLLRRWSYRPRRPDRPSLLGVEFADGATDLIWGFSAAALADVVNVHDALAARLLWGMLHLERELGPPACSNAQWDLTCTLSPDNGDVFDLLHLTAEDEHRLWSADARAGGWRDDLRDAATRVDLALRLFELPDLAAAVLASSRPALVAAVSRAVEFVGAGSVRFPGPPIPAAHGETSIPEAPQTP